MRILHITRDFPPRSTGGISTAVGGMVAALRRAGETVAVISFDAWRPASARFAGTPELPQSTPDELLRVTSSSQLETATGFACAFHPDLLHVHHGMLWPWAAELRARLGVPALKTVHVVQSVACEQRGLVEETRSLRDQRAALADAELILVPSEAAGSEVLRRYPETTDRLRVVAHGIDDTAEARLAAHHVGRHPHTVLYAGRFDDMKGTDILLAAMAPMLREEPQLACVIAGGIPANRRAEDRWRQQWNDAVDQVEGGRARVRFTGWLSPQALAQEYARASILVVPSRFETFGLTALEGMLRGAAVVASASGALGELIAPDRTGLLFPNGDGDALARQVLALARNPPRALALGTAAAAQVRNHYLWDRRLGDLLAAYRETSGVRPHSPCLTR